MVNPLTSSMTTFIRSWLRVRTGEAHAGSACAAGREVSDVSLDHEVECELAVVELHEGKRTLHIAVRQNGDRPGAALEVLDREDRVTHGLPRDLPLCASALDRLGQHQHVVVAHAFILGRLTIV